MQNRKLLSFSEKKKKKKKKKNLIYLVESFIAIYFIWLFFKYVWLLLEVIKQGLYHVTFLFSK